jgi:hypothetical protein
MYLVVVGGAGGDIISITENTSTNTTGKFQDDRNV